MAEENKYPLDYERRFGGVAKLYTKDGAERLKNAHVCVVGLGGVGSWAAEALARTAVGRITLVDLDNVAESNTAGDDRGLREAESRCDGRKDPRN